MGIEEADQVGEGSDLLETALDVGAGGEEQQDLPHAPKTSSWISVSITIITTIINTHLNTIRALVSSTGDPGLSELW